MRKTILLSIVVLLVTLASAPAATHRVPAEYATIQDAIDACVDGDLVVVAAGTYTGLGNRDIDFGGKAITVQSTDPQDPDVVTATVINCQGTEAEPHRGFYFHLGEDSNSVLSGLTITNGYAGYGGGIYCENSSPTITNCTFLDNTAQYWGFSGTLPPNENSSSMVNNDGEVQINFPPSPGWLGYGGGICCRFSSPTLTNCKIFGNSAIEDGGGMYNYYNSSPILTNCTFSDNSAGTGGGMQNDNSSPRLFNCIFSGNSAEWGGGCMNNFHGNPMLTNCTFNRNSAIRGGAILNSGSDATLSNCILWGNTAARGNEIYLLFFVDYFNFRSENLIRSTINVDYSDVEGGAAGVFVDYDCTLNWGERNIDADPCFVDADNGDYHLLFSSQCIDAGDPDYVPSPGEKDIDGEPRVIGGRVDMGVDEVTSSTLTTILRVLPAEFQFSSYENGPNPKEQIMSIRNIGIGTLNWEIIGDCSWLDVYPASGESTGQMNEVTLSFDISGMEPGSYECLLTIDAHDVLNSPQMVTLTLNLGGSELFVPSEYDTIQAAIDAAIDWDTVIVAEGTYTGTGNRDLDFCGKAITVRSENPNDPVVVAATVIDCQGSEASRHRGFRFHSGEGPASVIDGLTITNGFGQSEHLGYFSTPAGGAIFCDRSNPTISRCRIQGNKVGYMKGRGGGMHNERSNATIINCTFSGNFAAYGAGMYNRNSCPTVTGCTFSGNSVQGNSSLAGGMVNSNSSPTITNCTFISNSSEWRGGGMYNEGYKGECNPILTNCTFSGNSADYGGGMNNIRNSRPVITNCTFSGNSAVEQGGGIQSSHGAHPTLKNCIVWGNEVETALEIWGSATVSYSNVEGGWPGEGNIDADPCFVELGYWAANELWIDGDYHLLPDSPCIDAGDPNYVPEPNETDLDGKPRVIGGRIDMGAYESMPSIPAEARIIPRTINLASKGNWLTCYIWLPLQYNVADIDTNSVLLEQHIKSEQVSVDEQKQVAIAKFNREGLRGIINTGEVELTITGRLTDGTIFEATDVIRVIDQGVGKSVK